MVRDLLNKSSDGSSKPACEKRFQKMVKNRDLKTHKTAMVTHFNLRRLGFNFYDESFDVSLWGIFILSFVVGIVGGIYGIGGGSIIAPFFVTFFGLPVYIVAGAALMGTFVTSIAGVRFYKPLPFFPQTYLSLLIGYWAFCSGSAEL